MMINPKWEIPIQFSYLNVNYLRHYNYIKIRNTKYSSKELYSMIMIIFILVFRAEYYTETQAHH